MIKFHGGPLSGGDLQASRFFRGRHGLVSFEYPSQISVIADSCESFLLDSGAFTAWNSGRQVDFDAYREWVRNGARHPRFAGAFIPDVIDGDEDENDMHLLLWPDRLGGIPVFHLHERLERLDWLIERFACVAIGSSGKWRTPGANIWWDRMAEVLDVACDSDGFPRTKLHGLRQLAPKIFTRIPYSQADSANAGINAGSKKRFGMYVPPSAALRAAVIADRIEEHQSPACWVRP